jgi:hypothetical protein
MYYSMATNKVVRNAWTSVQYDIKDQSHWSLYYNRLNQQLMVIRLKSRNRRKQKHNVDLECCGICLAGSPSADSSIDYLSITRMNYMIFILISIVLFIS